MRPALEEIGHICELIPDFPMHVFILCHFSSVVEADSILKLFSFFSIRHAGYYRHQIRNAY